MGAAPADPCCGCHAQRHAWRVVHVSVTQQMIARFVGRDMFMVSALMDEMLLAVQSSRLVCC